MAEQGMPFDRDFTLQKVLGDPVEVMFWNVYGLPSNSFSIDNGLIIYNSQRWPLLIDPEFQGLRWLQHYESSKNELKVLRPNDPSFYSVLELQIRHGHSVIIENIGETVDSVLDNLLSKSVINGTISIGSLKTEYSESFRLYLVTRVRNPHFMPEISTKVNIVNFIINQSGLSEELLTILVAQEEPELAENRREFITQRAANEKQLKEIQDKILDIIANSSESILDNDTAVEVLSQSKDLSAKIRDEQEKGKLTEEQIELVHSGYKSLSDYISILFFTITELSSINSMYQFSLELFNSIFIRSIKQSTESSDLLENRMKHIEKLFLKLLYQYVSRSLYERHRTPFSFRITMKTLEYRGEISGDEERFLLTGGISFSDKNCEKPCK